MLTLPTLTTPRLTLRSFTTADLPHFSIIANDNRIARHVPFPHPYGMPEAEAFLKTQSEHAANDKGFSLAVTLKNTAEVIGSIGCHLVLEHARASFGYWIAVPHWNHGYTTEAAAAFVHHLFTALDLHRVTAVHYGNNPASGRVMQKIGMTHEGTFRQHVKQKDTFTDDVHYALLRNEWLDLQKKSCKIV